MKGSEAVRNTENMKLWLFDLAHGNLDDSAIIKGFIKYYVLYGLVVANVKDDIHFRTNYGIQGEKTALTSLNKALIDYVKDVEE